MFRNKVFPFFRQYDAMDCGPTCLRMVSKFYGKKISLHTLRKLSEYNKSGVNLLGLSQAAETIGFETLGGSMSAEQLFDEAPLPLIVRWKGNHFVVVYKITANYVYIANPASGRLKYSRKEFLENWIEKTDKAEGFFLLLEPTDKFYEIKDEEKKAVISIFLLKYFKKYKHYFLQMLLSLFVGSALQLIFPFLTQSIVDKGINAKDLNFITLVLIAQLVLFVGRTAIEFTRNWILLHISTRINLDILNDFLGKLLKLPFSFFDTKSSGDIIQRINDHSRIESFLTNSSLNIVFSVINLIIFSVVIAIYNLNIFFIFLIGSTLYLSWILYFMKYRKILDKAKFGISSQSYNKILQLIYGMTDIRLNNCEEEKKEEWKVLQSKLFNVNIKSLTIGQYQQVGAFFFNEGKNILITYYCAVSVLNGSITLGIMLAIQYIIGQLNGPIDQMVQFFQYYQDAKLSYERLDDVQQLKNEEQSEDQLLKKLPDTNGIRLDKVSFQYPGTTDYVLKDISCEIPAGKVTAIVGVSGSGKTTLLKVLLKFYEIENGDISIGTASLSEISHSFWRSKCGVVMQDGYIFSDSIKNNINLGKDNENNERLNSAVNVANLEDFITPLPLGLNTIIGSEGNGISQGQKQRILIARSVYKNPDFIFLDEATNALDANNEKVIVENLNTFFKGKTVIIVAHRLSTVKNADNIIVLDKGLIAEEGNHETLTNKKGQYYALVKNQLELGV